MRLSANYESSQETHVNEHTISYVGKTIVPTLKMNIYSVFVAGSTSLIIILSLIYGETKILHQKSCEKLWNLMLYYHDYIMSDLSQPVSISSVTYILIYQHMRVLQNRQDDCYSCLLIFLNLFKDLP